MKYFLCIIIIFIATNPVLAEDNIQQEHIKQGFDYIDEAHYRDAIKLFEKVIQEDPGNAEAHYGLGISYLGIGDTETVTLPQLLQEAIYSFKKAQNFGATHPEIYYFLGLCYIALHDKELAIKQYDVLEGLNRDLADQLLDKIVDYERFHEETAIQEKVVPSDEKK